MSEQEQKTKGKGGPVFAVIAVVVIVALLGLIAYLLVTSRESAPEEERRNVLITPENVESVLQEMEESPEEESTAPGYYTVTMNPTWHFTSGSDTSDDAVVVNAESNTNDVYFDIVLAEDEEKVIYQSPVIPLGGRLEDIALDEPLEAGSHDCVVIYHLVDEKQNTLSTLRVSITIVVEQ